MVSKMIHEGLKKFYEQIIPLDFGQDAKEVPYTRHKIFDRTNDSEYSYKDMHVHEPLSRVQSQPSEQHPTTSMPQI